MIGVSEKAQDRSDLRRKKIETYNLVRFGLAVLGAMLGIGALGLCVESGPRSRRGETEAVAGGKGQKRARPTGNDLRFGVGLTKKAAAPATAS